MDAPNQNSLKVLTILVGLTLFLSLLNFVSVLTVSSKLNNPTGYAVGGSGDDSAGSGQPSVVSVSEDDDPVLGNKNAPVTVIEFSDFQCPFCERFYSQTLPLLEQNYISTGKVKLVYRDFPLSSIHPDAQKAAEAAECADEQGKFKEMHDKLFENQNSLSTSSLKSYAAQLGLDAAKFNGCLDSGKYASEVQKDFNDGSAAGVSGTPSDRKSVV